MCIGTVNSHCSVCLVRDRCCLVSPEAPEDSLRDAALHAAITAEARQDDATSPSLTQLIRIEVALELPMGSSAGALPLGDPNYSLAIVHEEEIDHEPAADPNH